MLCLFRTVSSPCFLGELATQLAGMGGQRGRSCEHGCGQRLCRNPGWAPAPAQTLPPPLWASLTPKPTVTSPMSPPAHAECPDSCVYSHWAPTLHLAPISCQALEHKDSPPTVTALAGPAQESMHTRGLGVRNPGHLSPAFSWNFTSPSRCEFLAIGAEEMHMESRTVKKSKGN